RRCMRRSSSNRRRLPENDRARYGLVAAIIKHPWRVCWRTDHRPPSTVPDRIVEGVGFEPTRPLRTHQFSRLALSTAQPPLRGGITNQESRITGREEDTRETTGRRGDVIAACSQG